MKTTKRARRRQLRENKERRVNRYWRDFIWTKERINNFYDFLESRGIRYGGREDDLRRAERQIKIIANTPARRFRCYDLQEHFEDKAKRELRRLHQDFEEQLELLQHLRDNNWTYDDYWTDDDILRCPCCGQFH